MAKKRKKKSGTRRRVGAMKFNVKGLLPYVPVIGIIGGLAFAKKINPLIDKVVDPTKVDQKLVAGGQTVAGGFLAFKKLTKNAIANAIIGGAGGAIAGAGLVRGFNAFGLSKVGGYQDVSAVSGYQDVRAVGNGGYRRSSRRPYASNGSLAGSGLMGTGLL